jgi:hypothetical protein
MATWDHFGIGALIALEVTLSADATAVELPGFGDYAGTWLMPVKYHASLDDAFTLVLVDDPTDGVDYLNGNGGAIADGTDGGFISPNDRWPINKKLYYTTTGIGAGTVTLTFYVSKDR